MWEHGFDRYVPLAFQVHVGGFSPLYEALSIEASKQTSSSDILQCISNKLGLTAAQWNDLELAEVSFLFIVTEACFT